MLAILLTIFVYVLVLVLHLVVPARTVDGYVVDAATGRRLRYRLNGLRVLVAVVALYALACRMGWVAWDVFYVHRFGMAGAACGLGLLFTLAIVLPARPVPGKSFVADLFLGRLENPQWRGLDAKMFLYLIGALMLELNVLSSAAHHVLTHPDDPSPGVYLYAALFSFFVTEYLNFEEVHLYTYDFFAERVGFKLGWGCLCFYPFFYCVGIFALADAPNPHSSTPGLVAIGLLFFCGWGLSRGANLQKFYFKTAPDKIVFGLFAPVAVTDGERSLLASGFWGLSRHVNYLGEIMMAIALALSLGAGAPTTVSAASAMWPWLYPLYYVALLIPRQADDDKRCAAKYGPLWDRYCERVPWRIIPWVY